MLIVAVGLSDSAEVIGQIIISESDTLPIDTNPSGVIFGA